MEAGAGVVRWGTMLQSGRSRVRFPVKSLNSFNLPNPSSHTMALGSTQPLMETSIKSCACFCTNSPVIFHTTKLIQNRFPLPLTQHKIFVLM
jgi:hypothetical protein